MEVGGEGCSAPLCPGVFLAAAEKSPPSIPRPLLPFLSCSVISSTVFPLPGSVSDSGVVERNKTGPLLSGPANPEWRPPGSTSYTPQHHGLGAMDATGDWR